MFLLLFFMLFVCSSRLAPRSDEVFSFEIKSNENAILYSKVIGLTESEEEQLKSENRHQFVFSYI